MRLTTEQIKAAFALAEKATEGPWHRDGELVRLHDDADEWDVLSRIDFQISQIKRNAAFIAAARTDVPDLAADLLEAREEIERLRADKRRCHALLTSTVDALTNEDRCAPSPGIDTLAAEVYRELEGKCEPGSCTQACDEEFARLRALTEWRPISEAPRDGTLVLVWPGPWIASFELDQWDDQESGERLQPTHWMPLPAPPVTTVASAEAVEARLPQIGKEHVDLSRPGKWPIDGPALDLDLLLKLARGEGGERTGALNRAGLLEWRVTPAGIDALRAAGQPVPRITAEQGERIQRILADEEPA